MPTFDLDQVPAAIPDTPEVGTAGDFGKTFAAGAADVGSNLAGLSRYFYEAGGGEQGAEISRGIQQIFGAGADAARDAMNPETRKLAASALTSPEFWEHPVLSSALKVTGMSPSLIALAVPGGLVADTLSASLAVAGGGAALGAGAGIDEFYKKLDEMPDKDLQEQSPRYAAMREFMDEKDARSKFAREAQGWAPAINAVLGAGASVIGPAGTAARRLAGGVGNVAGAGSAGAVRAGTVGAAEGALGNAVQGGAADILAQQADIEANFAKDMDYARAANAALEGGAFGGALGGIAGAVLHGRAPAPETAKTASSKLDGADAVRPIATADVAGPQPDNGRATSAPAKPVESVQVGNPQSAPARSETVYEKKKKDRAAKNGAETVAPVGPDASQQAAIASAEPVTETPDAAAALARITAAVEQPAAPPVTSEVAARPVPPEVQQASRSLEPPAPLDTGMNAPEQPAALAAQQEQVGHGNRKAVMYPKGTPLPAKPDNMARINTPRGVVDYDPKLVSAKQVVGAVVQGRENEILGLGPVSKAEVAARMQNGERMGAVTERTPDGLEVKGALGTEQTLPHQMKVLEENKSPGNTVQIEEPGRVIERRGRILPDLRQSEAERGRAAKIDVKENLPPEVELDAEGNPVRGGKRYSKKEKAELEQRITSSKEIVERNAPGEGEDNYLRDPAHRDKVIARARAMVKEAEDSGVKIAQVLRRSEKGNSAADDPNTQILTVAKALVKVADRRKQGKEITEAAARFKEDEALIRAGMSEDVLARRRAEGDQAMNRRVVQDDGTANDGVSARIADNTEERVIKTKGGGEQKVTAAQAASGDKLAADAERKAKLIAEMNAKLRAPTKSSTEKNALRVERNPSEAQKQAGNYKKGHRRVEGLDFTIENPKGAIRRGRGPEGEWQVRMPADYGYIRRTTGADGDHIDAYDLRSGGRHFVVDQLDHRTGEFDEHKVILRAKDEAAARAAYEKAFSDGKGADRIGHIHELSTVELKDWLRTGDHTKSHLENQLRGIERDPDRVNFDVPEGRRNEVQVIDGPRVKVERTAKAADELASIDFSKMPGVGGVLGKFFASRLSKLAADVDVHYVTPEVMGQVSLDGRTDNLGLHIHSLNDPQRRSQIFISTGAADGLGYGSRAHVLLHELAHRVTVREIDSVRGAHDTILELMEHASKVLNENVIEADLTYGQGRLDYGFTNAKEFVAEAFSNPHFQEFLATVPVPPELAKRLGLHNRTMSMWDVFRGFVKKAIEKITGQLPQFDSVLDGIMRVGENLTRYHEVEQLALKSGEEPIRTRAETRAEANRYVDQNALKLMDDASEGVRRLLQNPHLNTQERGPLALKLRTFDNIAQLSDHYFGEGNPIRKIYNAVEKMRVTSEGIFQKSEPLLRKMVDLRSKNPEAFGELSSLLHDATVANVHPDVPLTDAKNAHLGKKRVVGGAVWAKAAHPELARRFSKLPEEYKAAWHEVTKHFRDTQNEMSLGIIENRILKAMGIEDAGLAKRIHEGTATDADRARVGEDMFETIEQAGELSKIEGPYVPLMRRGDHVVKGDYRITAPSGSKSLSPNEFEFTDQKAAEGYAKSSSLPARIKKVWVDEKTGETHEADPVTGDVTKISAKDLHAVPRWRVEVQNRHVEFIEGRTAAERRAAELAADGNIDVHKVVPRAYEVEGRQATELSASLQRLVSKLEKSEAYKQSTPTQRAMLRQAVEEAAVASHGSTRIQSKSLPRRGVIGYSEDLVKNMSEYGESSSRYLAKLEHMPEVEAGMKSMEEQLKRDHSKVNQYGRTTIRNEVVRRVNGDNGFEQGGKFSPVVKRAMSISFIDKLASPAYSVINAMQPGMVAMPYLAGRHGVARTVTAMSKAYNDISALQIVKKGITETGRRLRGSSTPDDFITNAKGLLKSADEKAMIEHMVEHGVIDPSAGMEVRELARDYTGVGGKIDAGLGYLEGVTREMPRAIEAINRMATALSAYRLERARGATHDAAVSYAQDAVNNTQFNYSPTNAPPLFNHPLAKMAFQFKKYGQGMYQLIGGQIGRAYRNASPGDRAEAVKTLIALAGTHMAMAGALGLPTEPFKYLVMASGLVGGPQWGDVEDKVRKVAADVLGKTGGEVFSRGLPRLINLDLSRVGLDSVTSFGEPRSGKDADVKSWLFDTVAGPVAGLGVDYAKSVNLIASGEYLKAAEKMIPIKAASDSLRAYRQATEGKKSASGKQTSAPYSFPEAAMRAAGFGNAREAEEGAANSSYYRNSERQKEERGALVNAWVNAKPTEKAKAMAKITQWNQGKTGEVKITPKNLTDALNKRQKDEKTAVRGIVPGRREKHLLEEGAFYNVR